MDCVLKWEIVSILMLFCLMRFPYCLCNMGSMYVLLKNVIHNSFPFYSGVHILHSCACFGYIGSFVLKSLLQIIPICQLTSLLLSVTQIFSGPGRFSCFLSPSAIPWGPRLLIQRSFRAAVDVGGVMGAAQISSPLVFQNSFHECSIILGSNYLFHWAI